jgi:hypothetical protein
MRAGVWATANKRRVALFTPTSVAWALSKTAVSSSNTLVYSNSVLGWGLAAFKVAKKGSIWFFFMALIGVRFQLIFFGEFSHAICTTPEQR